MGEALQNLDTTAAEYRRLNGLGDDPVHIDQDKPELTEQAFEPEGGYGGAEGDPDTANPGQGVPPFAVQRQEGDAVDGELEESPKHMAENGSPGDTELKDLTGEGQDGEFDVTGDETGDGEPADEDSDEPSEAELEELTKPDGDE
jgi:hypothetical protein